MTTPTEMPNIILGFGLFELRAGRTRLFISVRVSKYVNEGYQLYQRKRNKLTHFKIATKKVITLTLESQFASLPVFKILMWLQYQSRSLAYSTCVERSCFLVCKAQRQYTCLLAVRVKR